MAYDGIEKQYREEAESRRKEQEALREAARVKDAQDTESAEALARAASTLERSRQPVQKPDRLQVLYERDRQMAEGTKAREAHEQEVAELINIKERLQKRTEERYKKAA